MLAEPPLLLIDVDGVVSVFDFDRPRGHVLLLDGFPHHLSREAAQALRELTPLYEMVWCTGWEERAEEHLPRLLGLAGGWPHLQLDRARGAGTSTAGHWKLDAIDAYAGGRRALAWIDDAHDDACAAWAIRRSGPTLLVTTDPKVGLTTAHAEVLDAWARALRG